MDQRWLFKLNVAHTSLISWCYILFFPLSFGDYFDVRYKVLFGFEEDFEDIFIFGTSVFTFGSVDFHMKFWSEPKVKADVPKVKSLWESSSKPNKALL